MSVRLLANENCPRALVSELRMRGHDVAWVKEDSPSATDGEVLERAQAEGRTIATFDKDFGGLAFQARLPAECGVVLLRTRGSDPTSFATRAVEALESRETWSGLFAVIDDEDVRVRPLPRNPETGSGRQ